MSPVWHRGCGAFLSEVHGLVECWYGLEQERATRKFFGLMLGMYEAESIDFCLVFPISPSEDGQVLNM